MIHDKNDELKDVSLFRLEIGNLTLSIWKVPVHGDLDIGNLTLSIWKVPVHGDLDIYNGKHCFSISWKYFYFGVSKQ